MPLLSRRNFCAAPALLARAASPLRPNVILILTDDQGYGDLACHRHPHLRTPHLDRLHAASVRFTNFHVDPTCSPTRSALMTGRYSHRTGVWHTIMGRNFLRQNETTMADLFRAAGYRTGIFGKWHLGGNYPFRPIDRGFDEWVGHGDGGTGTVSDYWGNDKMNDTYLHNGRWRPYDGFGTDIYFREAMRFIERSRRQPFFVYLATNDAHSPCNVPRPWLDPYLAAGVPRDLSHFYASIEGIDRQIGLLRSFLARRGLADNTLLLFLTDNGSARRLSFNPGLRGFKGSYYDGGHRVPLFLHWPRGGLGSPRDIATLTAHLDLLPTLIELCDLTPPGIPFDGRSLAPLLRSTGEPWPDRALLVESQRIQYPEKWRQSAMMTSRWRLINGQELYDAAADPAQQHDVAARHPGVVSQLRDRYEALWEELSARDREFCRVVLGSDRQPESVLGSIDWFAPDRDIPWDQPHVLAGRAGYGSRPVEVARAGLYRIALRRWPRETQASITAPLPPPRPPDIEIEPPPPPPGVALPITRASLRVGALEKTVPVTPADQEAVFEVSLPAGPAEIEARFHTPEQTLGAYYVYARRAPSA